MVHALECSNISDNTQVPNTGKEVRFKIIRNIGTAFVRMGQFQVGFATFLSSNRVQYLMIE